MFLRTSSWSFEQYLLEYNEKWEVNSRLPEYRNLTLYTTWDLSYSKLCAEAPIAAQLLGLLAYFDNQSIRPEQFKRLSSIKHQDPPRNLITRLLRRQKKSADSLSWLQEADLERSMSTLAQYHFLELQINTKSYSMHNIVHDWTLVKLNATVDIASYTYAFKSVIAMIDPRDKDRFGWVLYARTAVCAARLAHPHLVGSKAVVELIESRSWEASWILELLSAQLLCSAAERMYTPVLAAVERASGPDHIRALEIFFQLGLLYCDLGKLVDAEKMFVRALAGQEVTLGPHHISTLNTISSLGAVYRKQGRLQLAEETFMQSLDRKTKAFGADHYSILTDVNDLGLLYRIQGRLDEAEKMHLRALARLEELYGPHDISTCGVLNNLGLVYRDQGKLDRAEKMFVQALDGYEDTYGENHTLTAKVRSHVEEVRNAMEQELDLGNLNGAMMAVMIDEGQNASVVVL